MCGTISAANKKKRDRLEGPVPLSDGSGLIRSCPETLCAAPSLLTRGHEHRVPLLLRQRSRPANILAASHAPVDKWAVAALSLGTLQRIVIFHCVERPSGLEREARKNEPLGG